MMSLSAFLSHVNIFDTYFSFYLQIKFSFYIFVTIYLHQE